MQDVTCTVEGLSGIEEMLKQVAPKAAKTAIRRAMKKGGAILQEAIAENAPKDTGFLSEHIGMSSRAGEAVGDDEDVTGSISVAVGPEKSAFYGVFQEFGTRHQPAQPFVGPAFGENADAILEAFTEELQRELKELKE